MTLSITVNGTPLTNQVRLRANGDEGITGLSSAADGSGAMGGIVIDDPDGDTVIKGWDWVVVEESACVSAPRLFTGLVADHTERRGKYRSGAGREIDVTLLDLNILLAIRAITNQDGKRPAESDIDRVDWLLGSPYLSGLVSDLGLVNRSIEHPFEEANYRGQFPIDVLTDIAGQITKTYYVYWDQVEEAAGLFYDLPTASTVDCTIDVSNVLSDVDDDTVFAPYIDGERVADPSDVYSKMRLAYANGVVLGQRTETADEFFSTSTTGIAALGHRDIALDKSRIGVESTARARVAQLLATKYSAENVTVTFTLRLPADKVGLVQAGMRMLATFTHLTDYQTGKRSKITLLNVRQTEGTNEFYDLAITLNDQARAGTGGGGAPGTDEFPYQVNCESAGLVQWVEVSTNVGDPTLTFGSDLTVGNLVVAAVIFHDNQPGLNMPTMTGWTMTDDSPITVPNADGSDNADGTMAMFYRYVADGDGDSYTISNVTISTRIVLMEFSGSWVIGSSDNSGASGTSGNTAFPAALGSVAITAESLVVGIAIWSAPALGGTCTIDRGTVVTDGDPGAQGPPLGVSWEAVSTPQTVAPTMTLNVSFTATNGHAGMMQVFTCANDPAENPPAPAQPFGPVIPVEAPDGSRTTFTLPAGYEFADGSLRVYVDRLDQSAAITSYDGAARTFTLAFAPTTGELVEAYGMGR